MVTSSAVKEFGETGRGKEDNKHDQEKAKVSPVQLIPTLGGGAQLRFLAGGASVV